jgi:hypothetical protein
VYWINIGRVVVFRVWALFLIFFFDFFEGDRGTGAQGARVLA